jgi:hypothetical protein
MCRNVRSIEWHQKTYHEISWDYLFNMFEALEIRGVSRTVHVFREFIFDLEEGVLD